MIENVYEDGTVYRFSHRNKVFNGRSGQFNHDIQQVKVVNIYSQVFLRVNKDYCN